MGRRGTGYNAFFGNALLACIVLHWRSILKTVDMQIYFLFDGFPSSLTDLTRTQVKYSMVWLVTISTFGHMVHCTSKLFVVRAEKSLFCLMRLIDGHYQSIF